MLSPSLHNIYLLFRRKGQRKESEITKNNKVTTDSGGEKKKKEKTASIKAFYKRQSCFKKCV